MNPNVVYVFLAYLLSLVEDVIDRVRGIGTAVEGHVDGGAEGEEEVRDEGADLNPPGPVESDHRVDQGVHQLQKKNRVR